MNFIPQRDYVLINPKEHQMTAGGLHLVHGKMEKSEGVPTMIFGEVVAAAAGFVNENGVKIEVPFKAGDIVAYSPSAPQPIGQRGGNTLHLVKVNCLLALVEGFGDKLIVETAE